MSVCRRAGVVCGLFLLGMTQSHANEMQHLVIDDPLQWRLQVSEGGQARLQRQSTSQGEALCVDWDFGALPGSLRLISVQKIQLSAHARLQLVGRLITTGAAQASIHLGADKDRQWSSHRDTRSFGDDWQTWRLLDNQFLDGRGKSLVDALPLQTSSLQLRMASPHGGRGQWCVSSLQVASQPIDSSALKATALADTATALQHRMVDGKPDTLWVSTGIKQQTLSIDLGREREIGGLVVNWAPGMRASHYDVQISLDGRRWQPMHQVRDGAGDVDRLRMGPLLTRYVRLDLKDGPNWRYGIVDLSAQPAVWGRTAEAWLTEVGKSLPPGSLPDALRGGPVQWRVLGVEGALAPAWFSDSGVLEPLPGQFTIEPWIQVDGQWQSPGKVHSLAQTLRDGASAKWDVGHVSFHVQGRPGRDTHGRPWIQLDYVLSNTADVDKTAQLALLIRPFQLQPAGRKGDLAGGVGGLYRLQVEGDRVLANDRLAMIPPGDVTGRFARHFDAGLDATLLRSGKLPANTAADDAQGLASGALLWEMVLPPGEARRYSAWVPLLAEGAAAVDRPEGFQASASSPMMNLPGDAGKSFSTAWTAAIERIGAEQAGAWLRVDSRLSLGAGNRDAMAMADALVLAGQFEPVKRWLLARISSGSTKRCDLLVHWSDLAGRIQAGNGWKEDELALLQDWLIHSRARVEENGNCGSQLSVDAMARAASSLATLMPAPVDLPGDAGGHGGFGVTDVTATAVSPAPNDSFQHPQSPDEAVGVINADAGPMTADGSLVPALLPAGPAAPPAQRRQRWMAALETLPADHLPPGWQRCSAITCDGLSDARQAASIITAIGDVLIAEDLECLRLFPGLPAELWGHELLIPRLATRWGMLGVEARREGDDWVIRFQPGLTLPPAGVVIDWPWRDRPGVVMADGVALAWDRGRLQLAAVPTELRIALPPSVD